jgi:6-pyruvoyltetrahydropterin/6-carboxytetrahydropterin synthase
MFKIRKEFHFSASHQLSGLPEGHPCGRLHGHNYIIIVELSSETFDETGFVEDYGQLNDIKEFIDDILDHNHLNDIMTDNPTAENIAELIYCTFIKNHPHLSGIGVKETPKTEAWFYKN